MGCGGVRFSPLEQHISKFSVITGFERHSPAHIIEVIKERSTAELVLSTQFAAIKTKLELKEGETALEKFYERKWRQEGGDRERLVQGNERLEGGIGVKVTVMAVEELAVAGVLLSKGTAKERAAALFDLFDATFSGTLPTKSIRALLKSLFFAAIQDLPLLVPMEQISDDMPKYFEKCQKGVPEAIHSIGALIMEQRDQVSKTQFEDRLLGYSHGALLTASGVREYALECGRLAAASNLKKTKKSL